jgi:hypothetical protein
MRQTIASLLAFFVVACSGSDGAPVISGQTALEATAWPSTRAGTTVVDCVEPVSACFDAARALCSGNWHSVAEPDMAFPAMIGDGNGRYRMLVACGDDTAVK